jgi:sec-independent protein translocase protein TatA
MDVGPAELIIVLLIVLLIFGGAKLPKLARSMGQAAHEFRKGLHFGDDGDDGEDGQGGADGANEKRAPDATSAERDAPSTTGDAPEEIG